MSEDSRFMRLAIDEAEKGLGRTSPNPSVGAVIVNNNQVVGKGYHHRAGSAHAEVNAIADAGDRAKNSTLYVTMEPCNHTGRTPPCTRAILDAGINKVVIGVLDPNPAVTGGGASFLQAQNISIKIGVLESKCNELIRPFVKFAATGLPWVIMKAGMSLDGKISYQRGQGGGITGAQSRQYTHRLRDRLDAILIGIETALIDNPSLTTRLPAIKSRDPLRVILDTYLRLPPDSRLMRQQSCAATWIFCGNRPTETAIAELVRRGAVVHRVEQDREGRLNLCQVLKRLGQANIMTVLVEGGAGIHGSFLAQNLVDEVYLFISPFFIGQSGSSLLAGYQSRGRDEVVGLGDFKVRHIGDDILVWGLLSKR